MFKKITIFFLLGSGLSWEAVAVIKGFIASHRVDVTAAEIVLRHWQFMHNRHKATEPCTRKDLLRLLENKMERYDLADMVRGEDRCKCGQHTREREEANATSSGAATSGSNGVCNDQPASNADRQQFQSNGHIRQTRERQANATSSGVATSASNQPASNGDRQQFQSNGHIRQAARNGNRHEFPPNISDHQTNGQHQPSHRNIPLDETSGHHQRDLPSIPINNGQQFTQNIFSDEPNGARQKFTPNILANQTNRDRQNIQHNIPCESLTSPTANCHHDFSNNILYSATSNIQIQTTDLNI